jgi:hypothetical protein
MLTVHEFVQVSCHVQFRLPYLWDQISGKPGLPRLMDIIGLKQNRQWRARIEIRRPYINDGQVYVP